MMIIRKEEKKDYSRVNEVVKEAFTTLYQKPCDEHYILYLLRDLDCFIPELSFVLEQDNHIIGNIVFCKAVVKKGETSNEVLTICPIAVKSKFQDKGIGTKLLQYGLEQAKQQGYKSVIIYGNPKYYNKRGFQNAENFNITTNEGLNFDDFMALELIPEGLKNIEGSFHELHLVPFTKEELESFNQQKGLFNEYTKVI